VVGGRWLGRLRLLDKAGKRRVDLDLELGLDAKHACRLLSHTSVCLSTLDPGAWDGKDGCGQILAGGYAVTGGRERGREKGVCMCVCVCRCVCTMGERESWNNHNNNNNKTIHVQHGITITIGTGAEIYMYIYIYTHFYTHVYTHIHRFVSHCIYPLPPPSSSSWLLL
jgi:hypothetical protein